MSVAADPCILVIFGASGDLTKRLLMPALYNLACNKMLPEHFAIVGIALEEMTTEQFRERMTKDIQQFKTRPTFDEKVWADFVSRLHYTSGNFNDHAAYERLATLIGQLEKQFQTGGNLLFYMAVPPSIFGLISDHLSQVGVTKRPQGWSRIVVEKPFGHDLASAKKLNGELLAHWSEHQIY